MLAGDQTRRRHPMQDISQRVRATRPAIAAIIVAGSDSGHHPAPDPSPWNPRETQAAPDATRTASARRWEPSPLDPADPTLSRALPQAEIYTRSQAARRPWRQRAGLRAAPRRTDPAKGLGQPRRIPAPSSTPGSTTDQNRTNRGGDADDTAHGAPTEAPPRDVDQKPVVGKHDDRLARGRPRARGRSGSSFTTPARSAEHRAP